MAGDSSPSGHREPRAGGGDWLAADLVEMLGRSEGGDPAPAQAMLDWLRCHGSGGAQRRLRTGAEQ